VTLSVLVLPCARILLVQGGVYCLPCGWALGVLPTRYFFFLFFFLFFLFFFLISHQVERRFQSGSRTTNHSIRKWVPFHYPPVVWGHLGLHQWDLGPTCNIDPKECCKLLTFDTHKNAHTKNVRPLTCTK
jgi:hypothetical protein